MRLSRWGAVLPVGTLSLFTTLISADTPIIAGFGAIENIACYKSADTLTKNSSDITMSDGKCQQICAPLGMRVMATIGGTDCYCGDELPALDQQVIQDNCKTPCGGYSDHFCGGPGFFQLYYSGLGSNVQTAPNATDTTTGVSATVVTQTAATVTVPPTSDAAQHGGPNKVGIAIGVIMGLVIVSGVIGATIFLLKQRKRRAIEEEHKRNAAVNDFIGGKQSESGSVTDQRLDPSFLSSHRRESIGSIADEMDFSRRILQVRNPDHRASQASALA